MATHNDITGDAIITKTNTDNYRDGWDRIFGKNKKSKIDEVQDDTSRQDVAEPQPTDQNQKQDE